MHQRVLKSASPDIIIRSKSMRKYDIVIIGGGFAGASLAYKLSKLNSSLEIALIERRGIGCKPVSAFTFTDVLGDLGIGNSVRQYYNQIEIISTLGARESYTYDDDVFAFIDYGKACMDLVERSGCQVIFDEVISIKGGKVVLKDEVMEPKVIVDASGWGYKFRKELGMDVPGIENHLYLKRLTNCSITNPKSLQLVFGDIGTNGGWFYPINDTECEIGVAERTRSAAKIINFSEIQKKNMENFISYKTYSEMLEGSCSESETMAFYPYEPVKRVVKGNVLFLGDNAGMVHPVFGMGIHYIHKMGTICAEHCVQAAHGDMNRLKEYQSAWDSLLKKDMNAWIWGQVLWGLNIEQIDKVIEIRSKSHVDKINVLSELRGHIGNSQASFFRVPKGLYLALVRQALINKIRYKLKYRC